MRSSGTRCATSFSGTAFLKVTMPENEMWKPSSIAACATSQRLGEAVHHAARLARALLAHDAERVLGGVARVDHQRLAALARGADVGAEALALPLGVALDAEVVEAGLADRDDLRRRRPWRAAPRASPRGRRAARRDARPPSTSRLGCDARHLAHRREGLERRADGERVRDAVGAHAREHAGEVGAQLGKIEVAMGVDEHRPHFTGRHPSAPTDTSSPG